MNYLRLFIACKLNKDIIEKSIEIQKEIKKLDLDAKWVSVDNMHITLKFLGAVKPELLENINKELQIVARNHTCFDIAIENIGIFPTLSNPKVIWIGSGKGSNELALLEKDIEHALKELNLPKDEKEFSSHITLARLTTSKNKEKIAEFIKQNSNLFIGQMEIKYFTLFQSQLTRTGPIYSDLKTFMLKPK